MATATAPATPSIAASSLLDADYKIIIVEGNGHRLPKDTPMETIKAYLKTLNYPGIDQAEVRPGKQTIDGLAVETYEFVKVTGTKG